MQRRLFLKNTALSAVAISASGFISFDGEKYISDCETTSDILGPFYRPNSPLRNNLAIKDSKGALVELSGIIKHNDCKTPFKKAKIELWHCSSDGNYDNSTDAFTYRGTTYSDDNGQYTFTTNLPVPYDVGGGNIRPAHFHLMVSAGGYQPLITQLYFAGDAHISKDAYASSKQAERRILKVQSLTNGNKKVIFNVSMSDKLAAEPAALKNLTGVYVDVNDKEKKIEFFEDKNELWMKNEVYGMSLVYIGNNKFQYPGLPSPGSYTFLFEITAPGMVKLTSYLVTVKGEKRESVAMKT